MIQSGRSQDIRDWTYRCFLQSCLRMITCRLVCHKHRSLYLLPLHEKIPFQIWPVAWRGACQLPHFEMNGIELHNMLFSILLNPAAFLSLISQLPLSDACSIANIIAPTRHNLLIFWLWSSDKIYGDPLKNFIGMY